VHTTYFHIIRQYILVPEEIRVPTAANETDQDCASGLYDILPPEASSDAQECETFLRVFDPNVQTLLQEFRGTYVTS